MIMILFKIIEYYKMNKFSSLAKNLKTTEIKKKNKFSISDSLKITTILLKIIGDDFHKDCTPEEDYGKGSVEVLNRIQESAEVVQTLVKPLPFWLSLSHYTTSGRLFMVTNRTLDNICFSIAVFVYSKNFFFSFCSVYYVS